MDMVYDILIKHKRSMHVDDIIAALEIAFAVKVDKESLVSALSKRVARHDRFVKTAPNTFGLLSAEGKGGKQ